MFAALYPTLQLFAADNPCAKSFLGLVTWFNYLPANSFDSSCNVMNFTALGTKSGFLLIGLAVLDDLIRIAALVSVGYVIYGGVQYVTSQGSPDATKKAQQTIINALIGVVVAVMAASLVTFLGNRLGG